MTARQDAARARLRGRVTAAAGQAALDSRQAGHWHLHLIALPGSTPGDFTPHRAPEYAEDEAAVHEQLLEWLATLFDINNAGGIARRGPEADREAGS
jgi:hypothetical protein